MSEPTQRDRGYVEGLRRAAQWAQAFDQDLLPDFGRATCQRLAKGLQAMADSASERLNVKP